MCTLTASRAPDRGELRDDLDLDEALISHGEHCCTVESAMARLGRSESATRSVIQRLLNQRRLFSPARGFYVVVPADYRAWHVVPATYFVNSLMNHLGRRYYVALLSAAAVHGAAHQRPQVFQVMVDRPTPNRAFERVRFVFCEKAMAPSTATVQKTTPTGRMLVSSPELTVRSSMQPQQGPTRG
jgi:predicted transcriptional regulator of viral defense system